MTIATHQTYKMSQQGAFMATSYSARSTIRPTDAKNIAFMTAKSYSLKTIEERKSSTPHFTIISIFWISSANGEG